MSGLGERTGLGPHPSPRNLPVSKSSVLPTGKNRTCIGPHSESPRGAETPLISVMGAGWALMRGALERTGLGPQPTPPNLLRFKRFRLADQKTGHVLVRTSGSPRGAESPLISAMEARCVRMRGARADRFGCASRPPIFHVQKNFRFGDRKNRTGIGPHRSAHRRAESPRHFRRRPGLCQEVWCSEASCRSSG